MCKKLIVLLVAVLSIPASAAYIGFDNDGNPGVNGLPIDVDGGGVVTSHCGMQSWLFASSWTGPVNQNFTNPQALFPWEVPNAQLEVYRKQQDPVYGGTGDPAAGISRNRSSGLTAVLGTGDFSAGTRGFGMNYLKLTLSGLQPSTTYKFSMWAYEAAGVWVVDTTNPDRKFIAYSLTNPKAWLDAHAGQYRGIGDGTFDPNGYGPMKGDTYPGATTDSNMPGVCRNKYTGEGPSLWDLVEARADANSPVADDHLMQRDKNCAQFYANTDSEGRIVIYSWMDATDWGNSMHVSLNGLYIIPEPATIALLGLGGLALIRRKRA